MNLFINPLIPSINILSLILWQVLFWVVGDGYSKELNKSQLVGGLQRVISHLVRWRQVLSSKKQVVRSRM
jgi:hypothetical protein